LAATPNRADIRVRIFGALVVGLYRGKDLHYVAHVGGGFNQRSLAEIYKLMQPLKTKASPFVDAAENQRAGSMDQAKAGRGSENSQNGPRTIACGIRSLSVCARTSGPKTASLSLNAIQTWSFARERRKH